MLIALHFTICSDIIILILFKGSLKNAVAAAVGAYLVNTYVTVIRLIMGRRLQGLKALAGKPYSIKKYLRQREVLF